MIESTPSRERGASLTEYALIMGVFVAVLIGVIPVLTDDGGALLNDTESGIATPRPFSDAVVRTPVSAAPPWAASTTLPSSLLTYVDKPVQLPSGDCLALTAGLVSADVCGGADELVVSGLSEDGTHLTLYLGAGTTCLTGVTATAPAEVVSAPCGGAGQLWTQESVSGLDVVYRHLDSGLCLTAATVASPPTTTASTTTTTAALTSAGALTLAACSGSADQIFRVLY